MSSAPVRPLTVIQALQDKSLAAAAKPPKPKSGKTRRVGLSVKQEVAKKASLRLECPSEYWVSQQIKENTDRGPDGERIEYRRFDGTAFPPPADAKHTAMCRCGHCLFLWHDEPGVAPLTPADVREGSVVCVEHIPDRMNEAFGPSPSGHAIATLQHRNLRLEECKLPSDSTKGLKREIRRFQRKKSRRA